MNKKIVLALLAVVIFAMPAFASVQNVKVSGDVDSTWLLRENFDLGANIIGDRYQNLFITQTRLRVDADLTDNVSTSVGLINERPWDEPTTVNTDIDLNVANAKFREFLYSPLTLVVGRQNDVAYGNHLVFDSNGVNNIAGADSGISAVAQDLTKQTALDGVRAILDYNPLTIDLVYFKVDGNTLTGAPDDHDDVDLYGTNVNYQFGDDWNSVAEAYFFARIDKSTQDPATPTGDQDDSIYLPGLRASTNPIKGLNVQGEVAWQRGNKVLTQTAVSKAGFSVEQNQNREAIAAQGIINYEVQADSVAKYKPVLTGVYTYVSGDQNPNSTTNGPTGNKEVWTAWDPFFENQGGGTIYNTLFDLTNVHIAVASLSMTPMEDVTTKVTWTGMRLDKKIDDTSFDLRQPDGGTIDIENSSDLDVGYEIDAEVVYDYTEDVQIGLNCGWFNPGDLFRSVNDDMASQAILHANVNF